MNNSRKHASERLLLRKERLETVQNRGELSEQSGLGFEKVSDFELRLPDLFREQILTTLNRWKSSSNAGRSKAMTVEPIRRMFEQLQKVGGSVSLSC